MRRIAIVFLCVFATAALYGRGEQEAAEVDAAEYTGLEAPLLAESVEAGELPPLEERLPSQPYIEEPIDSVGRYGGTRNSIIHGTDEILVQWEVQYASLVYWGNEEGEILPDVVRDFESNESGSEYTFYLREGMRWSDGEPYTVDDWIWWRDNVLAHDEILPSEAVQWSAEGQLAEFEKIDDYTVRVTFASPRPEFLLRMAQHHHDFNGPQPAHYFREIHGDFRDADELNEYLSSQGYDDWVSHYIDMMSLADNPWRPTLAPWIVTTALADGEGRIVMERNPYYWRVDPDGRQLPYMDQVVFNSVETQDVAALRSMQGDVDIQDRYILETLEQFPLFEDNRERGNFDIYRMEMGRQQAYSFNINHPDEVLREIIRDRRFRIALSHAMDREDIIELVYFGQGDPWQFSPDPGSAYTHEGHAKAYTEYDPDLANELLDEMGLTELSSGGYRLRPDGEELRILIDVRSDRAAAIEEANMIADYWQEVGVRAQANTLDRSLWEDRIVNAEFDINQRESNPGAPTLLVRPRFFVPIEGGSAQAPLYGQYYGSGGTDGIEPTGVSRDLVDLYDELISTPDQDEWQRIWAEIMDINQEHMFVLGTTMLPDAGGIAKTNIGNIPDRRMFPQDFGTHRHNWKPDTFYYID